MLSANQSQLSMCERSQLSFAGPSCSGIIFTRMITTMADDCIWDPTGAALVITSVLARSLHIALYASFDYDSTILDILLPRYDCLCYSDSADCVCGAIKAECDVATQWQRRRLVVKWLR
jgi:hypothetical protein